MKRFILFIIGLLAGQLLGLSAQAGNCDPDSLQEVTISGTITIETAGGHLQYTLQSDSTVYLLNFGPWWYQPSVGSALKPEMGAYVEIFGGLNMTNPGIHSVVIVYEIDGEFWRNPYDPLWNHFNDQYSPDPRSFGQGIACGWPDCSVIMETYSGIVMVDTTLVFYHYFLDADLDGLPDYRLNFGPPWYQPETNIMLPVNGDHITIDGAIVHVHTYPIIIVFTLNGETWRDETGFGPGIFGKWMHGNQNAGMTILSPFDTLSHIRFQNGWHHGNIPGSMYCQLLEVHHQNLALHHEHNAFAGFEAGCFNQNGENYMQGSQHQQGMMFNNEFTLRLHYTEMQLERGRIRNQDRIRLFYWDRLSGTWNEEVDLSVDTVNRIVTLQTYSLHPFYLLTGDETSTAIEPVAIHDKWFAVRPNPAQDGLTVEFNATTYQVEVSLMSVTGQLVSSRRTDTIHAGETIYISTNNVPAGIYYLRVNSGTRNQSLAIAIQHE